MKGYTFASCRWRALDREGDDSCRLARTDVGWILVGHARFRDESGFAALDYVVRCDQEWSTLGADVAGVHQGCEVKLQIVRENDVWALNDVQQPKVANSEFIDFSFTPATNVMPLWKLAGTSSDRVRISAAWLKYPDTELRPLHQEYRKTKFPGRVTYLAEQTGYKTTLQVDNSRFVTLYPGVWEGEVTHEAT